MKSGTAKCQGFARPDSSAGGVLLRNPAGDTPLIPATCRKSADGVRLNPSTAGGLGFSALPSLLSARWPANSSRRATVGAELRAELTGLPPLRTLLSDSTDTCQLAEEHLGWAFRSKHLR